MDSDLLEIGKGQATPLEGIYFLLKMSVNSH
jgi:hypothetical protein